MSLIKKKTIVLHIEFKEVSEIPINEVIKDVRRILEEEGFTGVKIEDFSE